MAPMNIFKSKDIAFWQYSTYHSVTYDIFLRSWQSAGLNQSLIDMKHFMDICYRLDKKLESSVAAGFEQGTFVL